MKLERFGTLMLPKSDVRDGLGQVDAATDFVATPIGGFDYQDDDRPAQDLPARIVKRGTLFAPTPAGLQTEIDALRSLRGKRLKLWARTYGDEMRWIWARLRRVDYDRSNRNFNYQPVTLVWDTANQHWRGHDHRAWTLDSGEFFDSGLYLDDGGYTFALSTASRACVVNNGGNRAVIDVQLTFTAASSPITAITVTTANGTNWTYSGTVQVGKTLVIDCGGQAVENDGGADYDNFSLNSGHSLEDWLRLEPGNTTLTVTRTGGGATSTLQVEFQDGWA